MNNVASTDANTDIVEQALKIVDVERPDIATVLRTLPVQLVPDRGTSNASYIHTPPSITINEGVARTGDVEDLASNLIHEGQHALDDTLGLLHKYSVTPSQLVGDELRAFTSEFAYVLKYYPDGKPENDAYDKDVNLWLNEYKNGRLQETVERIYTPDNYWSNKLRW